MVTMYIVTLEYTYISRNLCVVYMSYQGPLALVYAFQNEITAALKTRDYFIKFIYRLTLLQMRGPITSFHYNYTSSCMVPIRKKTA